MTEIECDVLIIGAGSGGIGAAIGAAGRGAKVVLVDRAQLPGGVVASAWVHTWEPTCGNSPLTRRLWEKMRSMPLGAAEVEFTTSRIRPDGERMHTMPFELWAYQRAVLEEFSNFETLSFLGGYEFTDSVFDSRKIKSAIFRRGPEFIRISAKMFIDATGELGLARSCGCAVMLGTDSREDFHELYAPEKRDRNQLNSVNWIYRVRSVQHKVPCAISPDSIPPAHRRERTFSAEMPNGDILINICGAGNYSPEIPGDFERVSKEQYEFALNSYYWNVVGGLHPDWSLVGMAPGLGIRESYRLRARKIITLNDVLEHGRGYEKQMIAATNHPVDIHGTDLIEKLGSITFGIPYESLLSNEFDNLFIGSRGIGVSHIAGGATRLSRTVMTYGEAAGKAAAICVDRKCLPEDVSPAEIRDFEA